MNNKTNWIAHHGIKGQKWGVRRYQNEDGSLTSTKKKRRELSYGSSGRITPTTRLAKEMGYKGEGLGGGGSVEKKDKESIDENNESKFKKEWAHVKVKSVKVKDIKKGKKYSELALKAIGKVVLSKLKSVISRVASIFGYKK